MKHIAALAFAALSFCLGARTTDGVSYERFGSVKRDAEVVTNVSVSNVVESMTGPDVFSTFSNAVDSVLSPTVKIVRSDGLVLTNGIVRTVSGVPVGPSAVGALGTNDVRGAARLLPKYLWALDFDDSYAEDAAWYYARPQYYGGCSVVRNGDTLARNYDWKFDDAAEFVVRMSAGRGRYASVGVANCGTNLSERFVTSGEWSRFYKCLPGRTVDGVNENGVVAEVNVVGGDPLTSGWHSTGSLHPLAVVRWVLDNAIGAADAAEHVAANVRFPAGWTQNFHWMIADKDGTYIVENGVSYPVSGRAVMTNFRLYPTRDTVGEGQERYDLLTDGVDITNVWWSLVYEPEHFRLSDLPGVSGASLTRMYDRWRSSPRESHRGETYGGSQWWQTVHTSVYDIQNRTLRIAVQETDNWYVFSIPASGGGGGGVDPAAVVEIVTPMISSATNGLRHTEDMVVYGDTYENFFEYTRIEHDEGTFEIIGQPYKTEGGWYLTYEFDGSLHDAYAPGADDATSLYFTHIHCSVVADRVERVIHGPTADRLATTGGVATVVSSILERRLEEFEGTGDSRIVRGTRESDYWDIAVNYANESISAGYASEANVANTLWPSYWEGLDHPTTLAGYGISQEYLKAFTPETDTTVTYGTTAKATRIGGNSIELYGGSTFVSGTLKPVNDTLFKNPEQVLFQQLGYINLVDLIKQYIQADSSSGVMLTDASFAFTNSDGEVVFAPYVPNSERTTVSTDEGSLVYSAPAEFDASGSGGADYEIGGVRYFRAPDKDVPEKVCLTERFTNSVENAATDAANALLYSHAIHSYMTGTTNSYFAATNYVFGADAEARTKFAWEEGMDASTVPASMALYEIRDGTKQCVWDQRDWTVWYWSFKESQMRAEIAASNNAIRVSITNDANNAWAKRYASTGRVNPDPTTTYIDTQKLCLSPGMNWETVAVSEGCAYWTIVGNSAVIGGSAADPMLTVKDFEGNNVLKITKGEHMLAWLDSNDWVPGSMVQSDGGVDFVVRASVKPIGHYSTDMSVGVFLPETDDGCPAESSWTDMGDGTWKVHFKCKDGGPSLFAMFQVEVEGKTKVEYDADVEIKGGLIYNGVKIAPVIPSGASAGTVITWKVIN